MKRNLTVLWTLLIVPLFYSCAPVYYADQNSARYNASRQVFFDAEYERGMMDADKDLERGRLFLFYPASSILTQKYSYFLWVEFDIDEKIDSGILDGRLSPYALGYNDAMFAEFEYIWGRNFEYMFRQAYMDKYHDVPVPPPPPHPPHPPKPPKPKPDYTHNTDPKPKTHTTQKQRPNTRRGQEQAYKTDSRKTQRDSSRRDQEQTYKTETRKTIRDNSSHDQEQQKAQRTASRSRENASRRGR